MEISSGSKCSTSNESRGAANGQLLSFFLTAKDGLEYLTRNDWVLILDRSKPVTFKKGEMLTQQGKQTKMVYLLVKGRANVEADSNTRISHIGPGEICGEMSFLDRGQASASVIVAEDVEAYVIEWSALEDLFEIFPHFGSRFYRSLAVNLSRRLRKQISSK
jgi:extracellular factor (EF) 3-hydroxypalmitic acid methyl ester biosynthesis protein